MSLLIFLSQEENMMMEILMYTGFWFLLMLVLLGTIYSRRNKK